MVVRAVLLSLCLVLFWSHVAVSSLSFSEEEEILKKILQKYGNPTPSKTNSWLDNSEYPSEGWEDKKQDKRLDLGLPEFNNCQNEDMPFPCKSEQCISLQKICDDHPDCPDGYDEDPAVCRAYHRIPVEDLTQFVESEARWMIPAFFKGIIKQKSDLKKIAHALAVSTTIDDFVKRLKMNKDQKDNFEKALQAVRSDDIGPLESMNMPPRSWVYVKKVFTNLIKSDFLS